mgnify:FL=1
MLGVTCVEDTMILALELLAIRMGLGTRDLMNLVLLGVGVGQWVDCVSHAHCGEFI